MLGTSLEQFSRHGPSWLKCAVQGAQKQLFGHRFAGCLGYFLKLLDRLPYVDYQHVILAPLADSSLLGVASGPFFHFTTHN